jgi:hypothetical protein
MATILELIEGILGTTYYTTVVAPDGFPIVVYSTSYIVASLMLLMAFKAVITWITILVQRCSNLGGK